MTLDRVGLTVSVLSALAWAGCDASGLPTVPVSGQITFDGGPCPAEGTIAFSPIAVEEGLPRRPAIARFQKDGIFEVTSFDEGDGLLPGRYVALISCWQGQPSNDDPSSYERLNCIPRDYKPDEIVVKSSADVVNLQFNVPKKK